MPQTNTCTGHAHYGMGRCPVCTYEVEHAAAIAEAEDRGADVATKQLAEACGLVPEAPLDRVTQEAKRLHAERSAVLVADASAGCFTGDCPHDYADDCVASLREYVEAMAVEAHRAEERGAERERAAVVVWLADGNKDYAELCFDLSIEIAQGAHLTTPPPEPKA